jgi:hypothetical protein
MVGWFLPPPELINLPSSVCIGGFSRHDPLCIIDCLHGGLFYVMKFLGGRGTSCRHHRICNKEDYVIVVVGFSGSILNQLLLSIYYWM